MSVRQRIRLICFKGLGEGERASGDANQGGDGKKEDSEEQAKLGRNRETSGGENEVEKYGMISLGFIGAIGSSG